MQSQGNEEKAIAMAIVAPEVSQFSTIFDALEMQTLFIFYLNSGKSDFSVGLFQMKPSFIENLERFISKNKSLKKKYHYLLPKGSERDKRRFRLKQLSTLEGQLEYLSLFLDICKTKTSEINFKDDKDRLRYWATLYNSGLNLTHDQVIGMQGKTLFPHFSSKFNYADVALEFYPGIKDLFR